MGLQNAHQPPTGTPETAPAGFSTTVTDTTLSEALITLRKRRWVLVTAALVSLEDSAVRQATVHRRQSNLNISLVPKTDIIRISYNSLNPKMAADIVNKV